MLAIRFPKYKHGGFTVVPINETKLMVVTLQSLLQLNFDCTVRLSQRYISIIAIKVTETD